MKVISFLRIICISEILASVSLFAGPAAMSLREQTAVPKEGVKVRYLVWTCGTNTLQFAPPRQWRASIEDASPAATVPEHGASRIRLEAPNSLAIITLRYVAHGPKTPTSDVGVDAELARKLAMERFSKGRIVEENPCYSGASGGFYCDTVWLASQAVRSRTRIAVLNAPGGRFEFTLTTTDEQFQQYSSVFSRLLTSFKAGK